MTKARFPDRLQSVCREIDQIGEPEIAEMWSLYSHYYGGTSEEQFRSDLSGKTHVMICRNDDERIGGFSTIEVCEHPFGGERVRVLFSGDTIVEEEYWNRNDLAFSWIRFASGQKLRFPESPLYWFLIVKGHRTYRYLSVFGKKFFPAPDWKTPPKMQALMNSLAEKRFGDAYDPADGVIRFSTPHGFLKSPWSEIPENAMQRKEVRFFLERNPNYQSGDELVCLCEVDRENMKSLSKRIFDKAAASHVRTD